MGYAKHVGRVGALAVALGIGAAVATTPGVAWADGETDTKVEAPGAPPAGDPPDSGTSTPSTGHRDPGEVIRRNIERAADDLRDGIRKAITGVARSSGGAITSTHRNGLNSSRGNVPPWAVDKEEQPETPQPSDDEKSTAFVANNNASTNPVRVFTPPRWRAPESQLSLKSTPKPLTKAIDDVKDTVQQSINAVTGNQDQATSPSGQRNAITTFDAPSAEDVQQVRPRFVSPVNIMANVLNAAIAPFLNPTPGQPAPPNPVVWAVLAWVRRQVQDTPFGKVVLNREPEMGTPLVVDQGGGTFLITPTATDPDGDDLEFSGTVADGDTGTLTDNLDGTFTYQVDPAGWDQSDNVTFTVSDAADYPHLHGFASFLRPDGGHTDTVTVAIAASDGTLPEPDVITPPTERPGEPGVYDTKLQYDPETVSNVSAATGANAPKYFRVVSESYDPETGQYTAVLEATQAGKIRQGLGLDTEDYLNLQVIEASSLQTFSMRTASFSTLAEDPPEQALQLPTPPAAHFEVVEQDIPAGYSPAGVVVTDKYAYIISTMYDQQHPPSGQPSRVTVIGADPEDEATYNQVVTTIDVPEGATFAGLTGNRLYVASSPVTGGGMSTLTIINTDTNTVMDADEDDGENDVDVISTPRGSLNPIMRPDGKRIYLTNLNEGKLYVIDTDPTSAAYNTVVAEIPVSTLQTANPDGSTTFQLPISGAFNEDGSRLYFVRDTQTLTTEGDFVLGGELLVIDTDDNTVVGDPIDLGQYGGYAASDGRYLYVPTLDLSDYDQTAPDLADIRGYVTVFDLQGDPDNPVQVDTDTSTPEIDRLPVGNVPFNIAYSPDGSLAYVVSGGNGTIYVIDTATNQLLDLDPDTAGVQGIVFDETPSSQLGEANIVGISPSGNQLYVSNYRGGSVTALEFVSDDV